MPVRLPPRPRDEHLDTLESTAGKLLAAGAAAAAGAIAGRVLAFAHDVNDLFDEVNHVAEETGMSPVDVGFALLGDPEAVAEFAEGGYGDEDEDVGDYGVGRLAPPAPAGDDFDDDGVIDVDFDVIDDGDDFANGVDDDIDNFDDLPRKARRRGRRRGAP